MLGKKSSEKVGKNFFYIHTNIVTKYGGGKRAKQFFGNTRIVRSKNVGKKIVGKSAKKVFLYSHEYRDQKMGGKTRETIFPGTHE